MENKKQKEVFLASEGDQWFLRNKEFLKTKSMEDDILFREIIQLGSNQNSLYSILEIGCGNGKRLKELKERGHSVSGIDPSKEAIAEAEKLGVTVSVGTADELPFPADQFDIVVFGFCLYLCDREDLFKIAFEADRVLKKPGYIVILDFYSKNETANPYHHLEGIKSYKMDYRKLFDWHPDYMVMKQLIGSHDEFKPTDDKNEMISISILRKL